MARPIFFAVLIIILVYLPILTLEGVEGKMFRPMAITVVLALAGSLLLALTLMPVLVPWRSVRIPTREGLIEQFNKTLEAEVPGNVFSYSQPIELRVQELIASVRSDVAITVFGDDLDQPRRVGTDIVGAVSGIPGAADVKLSKGLSRRSAQREGGGSRCWRRRQRQRRVLALIQKCGNLNGSR